MRSVSIRQLDMKQATIPLGFEGENEFTEVRIDCKKTFDQHPNAVPSMIVTDPAGNKYPAVVTRDGDIVVWTITAGDLTTKGSGEIQIEFLIDGTVIGRTDVARTRIERSIFAEGEAPDPVQDWVSEANRLLALIRSAIPAGGTVGQFLGKKSNSDYDTEWKTPSGGGGGGTTNYNDLDNKPQIEGHTLTGNVTLETIGALSTTALAAAITTALAQAKQSGEFDGADGDDGVGIADIEKTGTSGLVDTYTITLTDGTTSTFTVTNGAKGDPGNPGADGVSPTVAVSSITGGHRVSVSDKNGTQTFDVMDGVSAIDDTAGRGDTNKVLSADKVTEITDGLKEAIENKPDIKTPEETDADLYISDESGNVVGEFINGGFRTKKLKGFDYITFKSAQETYTGTSLTLTVEHSFKKGDHLVLHVNRIANPASYGAIVSYYADETAILTTKRADICYIEYVCVDDCDEISVVYQGSDSQISSGTVVQLEVSLIGDIPITPTVVTVKKDGTGDFTTIRDAIESIGTKANDVLNPYRIEVYPGTYDVMDDYTSDEISAAGYDDSASGFAGPLLTNGMYLVGMGQPNEVILNGYLDRNTYNVSVRGEISTFNMQGTCGIENVTIIGENLRYCIHDDYRTPVGKIIKRTLKNVILRGYYMAQDPSNTYGCGVHAAGCIFDFENVDFGENVGIHIGGTPPYESAVYFKNCKGHAFDYADNESSDPVAWIVCCRFDNCDFKKLIQTMKYPLTSPHVIFVGDGGGSPLYDCDPRMIYNTGDVQTDPKVKSKFSGGVGTVVKLGLDGKFYLATSVADANGIVVATDTENNYIQMRGYVKTDRTSITSPSVGDYVGISSNSAAIVQNESDSFGKIVFVDNDGNGYIKLDWRV